MNWTELLEPREKAERPDLDETVINGPPFERSSTREAAAKPGLIPTRTDEPDVLSTR